jgi:uncharacterized protein YuzB (UPF0349 family)
LSLQIICCMNNLIKHQYGDKLNELAKEGVEISLERCLSQCVGCSRQPSFMADGKWYGLASNDDFLKVIYAKRQEIG